MNDRNEVWLGDCLKIMPSIDTASVDMILCDLPYGTTACKWDTVIPFAPLWAQYRRIIKPRGAIVLTASQPFTSALVMSAPDLWRHAWVWNKANAANVLTAKFGPLKIHEDILVFAKEPGAYAPQMVRGKMREKKRGGKSTALVGSFASISNVNDQYYPKSILEISNADRRGKTHPTQKPVALFEYLIKTYTNEGDLVLDNCAGSGTTAIACLNTKRDYILIEQDQKYFNGIAARLMEYEIARNNS